MAGILCGQIDVTKLPEDEIIAYNDRVWMKSDVDEKIYIVNNIPCVVIKFSSAPETAVCPDEQHLIKSLVMAAGTALNATSQVSGVDIQTGYTQKASNSCLSEQTLTALASAQNSSDSHGLNSLGYQPAAIMPTAAVVPMKSNIKLYGPYASNNFGSSGGGSQVSVDQDIAPWVFGSVTAMNTAALSIVNSSTIGLARAETGSITIPGMPDIATLGATVSNGGPNLTNINFTFGSGGITTSYEFRTFTPRFGDLNKHFIAKFKTIAKNRQEQLKMLRENQIIQNKIGRKVRTTFPKQQANNNTNSTNNAPAHQNSLQRVIIGEIYDWQGASGTTSQRTVVGTSTLSKSQAEMVYAYEKKAYMSFDGLFGPVSLSGDGGLPMFTVQYTGYLDAFESTTIAPNPPVFGTGISASGISGILINQKYLNPLQNSFAFGEHPQHEGSGLGHVIDIVGRESGVPESGAITNFYDPNDPNRYSSDYRFLGLRGPLVLHSWGYDIENKPIPNMIDNEENIKNSGTFAQSGLKDYFLKDWLKKPATWPVAPIDLRFDRERGVWVSPPQHKIVVAETKTSIPEYGSGSGVLINVKDNQAYGKDIYDKSGNLIAASGEASQANIIIEDRLGVSTGAGTRSYAYFDTFSSTYLLMGGGGGGAIKLGKYTGPWPKEIGKNIKPVTLYTTNKGNPFDWIPELEPNGDPKIISAINFISYVPDKPSADRNPWCYVIPFIQQSGSYSYIEYGAGIGVYPEVQTINYDQLYLLLAAEC